jgi:hypothetical protein
MGFWEGGHAHIVLEFPARPWVSSGNSIRQLAQQA